MYKIYCDNELIFDLSGDTTLVSPVLKLQDNNAGTIEFSILPEHFVYNKIRKMKSEIKVTSGEKTIFASRPIDETIDFKNCKKVMCEGALAYLNDSIQRPAEYHNLTIRSYLETLINYHNQQVSDPRLQFKIGMVTVHDDNDSIYKYTNWETTLQVIKTDLVDKYGGHLRVRFEGDTKYLDYLKDYPRTNKQVIEFGTNLLDFTKNIDATQIVTAVIPLGARLEESSIKKLEERLTIKSVNNNLDYVASKSAVDTYGWIFKTVTWDNVHKPIILKNKGEEYLKSIQFENVILKVKAIDLHMVNVDIEQIELLDEVRVISKPNGLDKVFPVSELVIDMMNPQANTITLGQNGIQAMSGSAVSSNNEIMKKIDSIPPVDDAINEAVKNATEMINNALNGHVVKRKDELLIMDTADMKTAKKVWRWNLNGLAYSNNGYGGPYETAMTMDGSIVANRITTGVLKGGFVKFDLTRGTFLIGRNDQDFLLKFDGEKLRFGNGTLGKDSLEKSLLEALKGKDGRDGAPGADGARGPQGKDGKSFKYNLISNGDFHVDFTKNESGHKPSVLNTWQVKDSSAASKMYVSTTNKEKIPYLHVNADADDTIEINQYLALKKNTKYYIKAYVASKKMRLYYKGSEYKLLDDLADKFDYFRTIQVSFETHDTDTHAIQLDCRGATQVRYILLSEEPIPADTEWYPSHKDTVGVPGPQGPPGPPGRDGSLVDLPAALKAWNSGATEISGKYVFTPELFVGEGNYEKKTGIYIGKNVRLYDELAGDYRNYSGMMGLENGKLNWIFTDDGNFRLGKKWDEMIMLGADGRAIIPKAKIDEAEINKLIANEIKSTSINTDMLIPGANNRIVMERGYSPGSNNAMSIDANANAIRLKYSGGTYVRVDSGGVSLYKGGDIRLATASDAGISVDRGRVAEEGDFSTYMSVSRQSDFKAVVEGSWVLSASSEGAWARGFHEMSDFRLKENVVKLDNPDITLKPNPKSRSDYVTESEIIDFVKNTNLFNYNFKFAKKPCFSMMAQSAKGKIKELLVCKNSDGNESIELYNYTSLLHQAIKNLFKRNDELENRVKTLEEEMKEIKKLLKKEGEGNA